MKKAKKISISSAILKQVFSGDVTFVSSVRLSQEDLSEIRSERNSFKKVTSSKKSPIDFRLFAKVK
jgi:hypothetical protein